VELGSGHNLYAENILSKNKELQTTLAVIFLPLIVFDVNVDFVHKCFLILLCSNAVNSFQVLFSELSGCLQHQIYCRAK